MNCELLMNDTLDNFNFTQSEKNIKLLGNVALNVSKTSSQQNEKSLEHISTQLEAGITLDDSIFFSESWTRELDEVKNESQVIEGVSKLSVASEKSAISAKNNVLRENQKYKCSQNVISKVRDCEQDATEIKKYITANPGTSKSIKNIKPNEIENHKHFENNIPLGIIPTTKSTESEITFDGESSDDSLFSSSLNEIVEKKGLLLENNIKLHNDDVEPSKISSKLSTSELTSTEGEIKLSLTTKSVCLNFQNASTKQPLELSIPISSSFNSNPRVSVYRDSRLSSWGLPANILQKYESKNLHEMFQWQVDCLSKEDVLENCKNFVYSAPTSAGKTLVAEILAIKTVLERKKKVIFILPFVSIVREKMFYFQDLLGSSGIRVEGFMGSYNPPGGFASVQVAICTIEKANNLINKLMEEEKLVDIGAVVVDEIHLLGDSSRGYLLELLLTKLRYISKKDNSVKIQIISMSATLPNLDLLSKWLDAELYTTNYRPIPLHEQVLVGNTIYDKDLKPSRNLKILPELDVDTDNILQLCLETIRDSSSVLIFCPTKNWCENLAQQISTVFCKLGNSSSESGELLRSQFNPNLIRELLQQLRYCPIGLDEILRRTVSFGVAFHHAGLTMDERDIIEGGFRNGALRVLVATSTLSSGVNLPARRVIIRTPNFHGKPIDTLTYRQMIGRAGRMGKDSMGESFLICQKTDYNVAKKLMSVELRPIESCLEGAGKLKRAILEVIASGVASSPNDIELFTSCTLLAVENKMSSQEDLSNPIEEAVTFLKNNELIRLQKQENETEMFVATSLGKACLSSSIAPDEGLALFTELEKARQCFVLETELHLIYLVTPYSACNSWGNIDWMFYLDMWEKLPHSMKRVGELVGVSEAYIVNAARGRISTNTTKLYHKLLVHKRFFVSLALQDLVNEKPLGWVCRKFNCNRGMLQSLQQSASSFAGMVTAFSRQLGWSSVELLVSQFQDRLQFGVSRDLLDLMHLPILSGKVARILFNAGVESLVQLANSKVCDIENILYKAIPFESEKSREGESEFDKRQRNKFRNVWVTGKEGLTEHEAAGILLAEARKYLKLEMGLAEAKWETSYDEKNSDIDESSKVEKEDKLEQDKNQSLTHENTTKSNLQVCSTEIKILQETDQITNPKESEIEKNVEKMNISNDSIFSNDHEISHSSNIVSNLSSTKVKDFEINKINHISHNENKSHYTGGIVPDASENATVRDINENDFSDFTGSFSNVDFSTIEKDIKATLNVTNNVTSRLSNGSLKNEISDCLSPSVEINISGSSIFSQNSFDESFNLHLSNSDQSSDSGIKEDNILCKSSESMDSQVLENAFSKTVNLESDDNSIDVFETSAEETSVKKRKSGDQELGTPSKKQKRKDQSNENKFKEHCHVSYKDYKESCDNSTSSNLTQIEIIDICNNISLFNMFSKEIKLQESISLSLACSRIEVRLPSIGCKSVTTEEHHFVHKNTKLNGISVAWGGTTVYYLSLDNLEFASKVIKLMKFVLGNKNLRIRMFESKEHVKLLKSCLNLNFNAKLDDPKVVEWILEPEFKEGNLQAMCMKYWPEGVELSKLAGNCKGVGSIGLDLHSSVDPKIRASIESILTWHLTESLKKILEEDLYYVNIYDIETDTLLCLAKMEIHGFPVSKESLQDLESTLKLQVAAIEKQAFYLAGRTFNFVSPASVAKVLGLNKDRKTSTRKKVLEQNKNPISDLIIQWRKVNTILTKIIYPFLRLIDNERIRGCYITYTSTGRISMHEPNLQNVAKEFSLENPLTKENVTINCRSVFAVSEGFDLVSADYCQIELRILTHFSKDKVLTSIMKKPGDVFKSIAAKWNHVQEDMVDDCMRQNTKHLCYGLIYGMGTRALSEQLDIDETEAITFRESFMNTYPAIQTFITETIETCRKHGYVETITGRRRYLPHINDTNTTKKSQAERQAVNTIIQGSAADISKKAMISIERELQEIFCKTKNSPKLVLHLHDELIYEVPKKYVRKVTKVIKKNMENSLQLSVPFPVKLKTGSSWGTMTEFNL